MTEELLALGKKASRARKWDWIPGMLTVSGFRVYSDPTEGQNQIPNFSDAATFGGLFALLKRSVDDFYIKPAFTSADEQIWEVGYRDNSEYVWNISSGKTQLEALISAIVSLQ